MALKDQVESLTEEVVCPICLDYFTDPVSLECGHNFCRSCITQSWDKEARNSCPECREQFTGRTLRFSWALARLSEKARTLSLNRTEKESKLQCEEHQEELKLFCETDKKLICVLCAGGREHRDHRFMLVDEAVETYKDQVKSSIQSLAKKQSGIQQMEQQQKQKISRVLEQSHNIQSKITSQYAELHQILTEKEQRALADIREEEKKILNTMEKNLGKIQENLNSIQEELLKLQQQMHQKDSVVLLKEEAGCKQRVRDDAKPLSVVDEALQIEKFNCPVSFNTAFKEISDDLKSYPALQFGEMKVCSHKMEKTGRKRRVRDEAKPLSVVDEALPVEKFHCPVSFNTIFKEISDDFKQVSVTLDVETAHLQLKVSEDRKRVRWTESRRRLPDTGKRFTHCTCVLGSEGFTSGRHYWEVEAAGSLWILGVAAESVERKRSVTLTPETGVWSMWRGWGDDVFDALTSPPSHLPARPIPRRLGIYLSYESGTVSFYDTDTKSHLHTFTGNNFTEKLYPFFWTQDLNQWLRICSRSAPGV
ncbi:zinc-binding protein A33-like [Leucoraja erinacea]|uniref:zinc-binding protein A33-like n=1 Tax=Leucoraja erinaceus TaxID=7782 RepID=UPI0024577D05|nr:zinc-binding protein A33-like [Leucoraja erinacea]